MREIITPFDATLNEGFDEATGLSGIVLESRGGTQQSNNYRNPEHSKLLRYTLEKMQLKGCRDIQFYVASRSAVYKAPKDRLLVIDGKDVFDLTSVDLDKFEKELKVAIKTSGQKEGVSGGNSTKRLLITSSIAGINWNEILL